MNQKLLRKKLALMLANLKKKRKYYCECEYLESTGTQYINLNYIPTDTTGYKMGQVIPTSNSRDNIIIGCRQATNSDSRFWQNIDWSTANKTIGWGFGVYSPSGQRYSIVDKAGTYVVTSLNYMNDRAGKVDDITYDTSLESKTLPEISRPMYLFAGNNGGNTGYYVSTKIYFVQITEGNKIVRDFIPVLDWNYVPCMYDRVTEQLFYNQGTGDFTYGREIHYVDYLESTGTQWIDTGIKYNINKTYQIKNKMVYTATEAQSQGNGWDAGGQNSISTTGDIPVGSTVLARNVIGKVVELTQTINSGSDTLSVYNYMVDGISLPEASRSHTSLSQYAGDGGYGIFAMYSISTYNYFCKAKCYKYKILESNVLVRDYIPAIDENGVGFMFDRVSHTCYLNQGTGAFKYPAREVEYLESTGTQYIDTGILSKQSLKIKTKIDNTGATASEFAYGVRKDTATITCATGLYGVNGYFRWGTSAYSQSCPYGVSEIEQDSSGVMVNGNFYTYGVTQTVTSQTGYTITLFAGRNSTTGVTANLNGKMYYFKVWDNGTLVRDFIPCYKDGVACMVDKLTGTAYLNQGTGSFSVGRIVEPEYE